MKFSSTITNEEVSALEKLEFSGKILVVNSAETMLKAYEILKGEKYLGFDTETRPAFRKGLVYKLALVQLSTASHSLLFRLQAQNLSPEIKSILEDKKVLKIGAALRDDVSTLQKSQGKMNLGGFVDLQNIVHQWGIQEKSVKKLSAIVLGGKISKAQRLSNWEAARLTHSQMVYAATDAWVCREIYLRLVQETDPNNINLG